MNMLRILLVWSALSLDLASGQVEEDALVASSPFRMAVYPTKVELNQVALDQIRVTAVAELKKAQSLSDLPYFADKTKIVLQESVLQSGEDLTIIRFFALTTQRIVSVPSGTAFREVRIRNADAREKTLNGLVEVALGSSQFLKRLQRDTSQAFEGGDGRVSTDTLSQILAIESIAVAAVAIPGDTADTLDDFTNTEQLSVVDVVLIVAIIFCSSLACFFVIIHFRKDKKAPNPATRNTHSSSGINRPGSAEYQLGTTPVIDEEAAYLSSSEESGEEDKKSIDDVSTSRSGPPSSSSSSATSGSESSSTSSSDHTGKSEHKANSFDKSENQESSVGKSENDAGCHGKLEYDASSISTPSLCSEKSSASRTSTGTKSLEANRSSNEVMKASRYYPNTVDLQVVSLSRSDSAAFVDDDVSDVVAELLKTTIGGTMSGHEILAETILPTKETSLPDNSFGGLDDNITAVESLAESFTSEFFGSKGSSSNEASLKGQRASDAYHNRSSSSSSYYSSGSSSEDLFNVDVEAASKKSGSMESKQSSAAAVDAWMKTIHVVAGSSTTDSKTTASLASSHDRSSVSSLTTPSMAHSIGGISALELSLGRLDRQAKESAIREDDECEL